MAPPIRSPRRGALQVRRGRSRERAQATYERGGVFRQDPPRERRRCSLVQRRIPTAALWKTATIDKVLGAQGAWRMACGCDPQPEDQNEAVLVS